MKIPCNEEIIVAFVFQLYSLTITFFITNKSILYSCIVSIGVFWVIPLFIQDKNSRGMYIKWAFVPIFILTTYCLAFINWFGDTG